MRSLTSRLDRLARQHARTAYPVGPGQIAARVRSFDYEGFDRMFAALLRNQEERGPEAFAVWVSEFQQGIAAMTPGGGA